MKRAFTAVELIVVLVIVAILAIMLVPTLESARTEAVRTKCLGRVRQIGMAFEMYQIERRGYWPSVRLSVHPEHPEWPDPTASLAVLYPAYASKTYLFHCPATHDIVNLNPEGTDFLNCENFYVSPDGEPLRPEEEGKRPPSPPSFFYDSGGPDNPSIPRNAAPNRVVCGDECVHGYWERSDGKGFWLGANNHPMAGGNFLFVDKHVEWLDLQWTGAPYEMGESLPFVPNVRLPTHRPRADLLVYEDTNVFQDDTQGDDPGHDADLAGMMWVDQAWMEY